MERRDLLKASAALGAAFFTAREPLTERWSVAAAIQSSPTHAAGPQSDLAIVNGKVITIDAKRPQAEAIRFAMAGSRRLAAIVKYSRKRVRHRASMRADAR